jgi:hypothetical protein
MREGELTGSVSAASGDEWSTHAEWSATEVTSAWHAKSRPQHCPLCESDLVQPTAWRQVDASTWELGLHCPDCGSERIAVLDRENVHAFNITLYQGSEQLARELKRLEQVRRNEDDRRAAAFVHALRDDLILPTDF